MTEKNGVIITLSLNISIDMCLFGGSKIIVIPSITGINHISISHEDMELDVYVQSTFLGSLVCDYINDKIIPGFIGYGDFMDMDYPDIKDEAINLIIQSLNRD